jgi:hypothetical protein
MMLDETGWGIIFADDTDPAIVEALQPLLGLRQQQAGSRFRMYSQDAGFRVGKDTKVDFLARNGMGPGPADPDRMPYYLMIVGSPEKIPYRFQVHLDVQYAVGRIHFETPQEYAAYAQVVVRAETGRPPSGRLAIFSVTNPDDYHTQLAAEQLTAPLMQSLADRYPQWMQQRLVGENATKAGLTELLHASAPPSVLFCVSHGVAFPAGDPRQETHQGALLCADWPGPAQWSGPIPPEFYFSAADLTDDMNMAGMIAFFWASYGGGTPRFDEFANQVKPGVAVTGRSEIASRPFLARLPMKMLGRPGGALAVVGFIDNAWGYSFSWSEAGSGATVFESLLSHLLDGHPLGMALEHFNERYAELSSNLSVELEDIKFVKDYDPFALAGMWTANNDARNYTLIGDPAVRLRVGSTR